MNYSLDPKEVRRVIDAKLKGLPFDESQFLYYHLNRNCFNVKSEITVLKEISSGKYSDNFGKEWREVSTIKNFYHMPSLNYFTSISGITMPYSRKFLRYDTVSGVGGEFEIVIRHDGKRIDAYTQPAFQETYNFAHTDEMWNHKKLDMDTHTENGNYTFKSHNGWVKIIESEGLFSKINKEIKKIW